MELNYDPLIDKRIRYLLVYEKVSDFESEDRVIARTPVAQIDLGERVTRLFDEDYNPQQSMFDNHGVLSPELPRPSLTSYQEHYHTLGFSSRIELQRYITENYPDLLKPKEVRVPLCALPTKRA